MRCPYCETINRDDREKCYHCSKDLSMLRLIVNRAKNHYNQALEHAERGRLIEAISELDSALQLDSSFSEARLLLGTLYARMERPEEARRQWEEVLGADVALRRAHEYLGAVGALKRTLPLARRVRAALIAATTALVFAVAVVILSLWPSREERMLNEAWHHFAGRDFRESTRLIGNMARPLSDDNREKSVRLLESSIQQALEERLQLVTQNIAQSHFRSALMVIEEIEALSPPPSVMHTLANYRSLIRAALEEQVATAAKAEFTAQSLGLLEERIEELRSAFPASSVGEKVLHTYLETGRYRFRAMLERIDAELAAQSSPSIIQLLVEDAHGLAALLDGEQELQTRLHLVASLEQRLLFESAREQAEAGNEDQALAILENLDPELAPNGIAASALHLRQRLQEDRRRRQIAELEMLIESNQHNEALALAELVDWQVIDEGVREEFQEQLLMVRQRAALSAYYQLMGQADLFETGAIEESAARDALAMIEGIDENLPRTIQLEAWDDLHFFAAVAHQALSNAVEADRAIESLRAEYPNSPYLLVWEHLRSLP